MPADPSPAAADRAAQFAAIESLFNTLALRAAPERDQALAATTDPFVRARVAALLSAHDRFGDDDEPANASGLAPGDLVGAYRLIERVGAGGMGEVFRAERADGVFTQQVAAKITRANVAHPDLLRRFAIERQILASLNHPNIVRLLEGGATAAGQAYLIMDFLEGEPLTRFAREQALSLEARLRLFCAVCGAVQHAHQHGVVHRDLKPANILVDRDGVPKVVDFGIAKLLESPHGPASQTAAMLPGPLTPNYASPEQVRGLPVTTGSDVYALGVVLYELLAGVRPYETDALPLDRVVDLVVREEPRRPSAATPTSPAPPPYRTSRLRGDLDAIVRKAMSKEPAARYASAGELAADIDRWLQGDPVLARDRSTMYVLRRLAARHRGIAATTAIALLAVVAALAVAAWQWQEARQAQLRAEQRLRDVRQLANSLIFKIQDAVRPLPGSTPVRRTIVNEAVEYLARLAPDAETDPTLRLELANAHRQLGAVLGSPQVPNLGDREGAIAQYERARTLLAPLLTTSDAFDVTAAFVHTNGTLASLYYAAGDGPNAVATTRRALEHLERYRAAHPPERRIELLMGQALFSAAVSLPDSEAPPAWQRTLAHYEKMLSAAPDDPELQRNVALVGKYLGGLFERRRDYAAARPHYERSLALDVARLKATPDAREVQFDAAISYSNAAAVADAAGDVDAAHTMFEQSVALRRQVSAADPENAQSAGRLAYILWRVAQFYRGHGEPERGLPLARESVERLERLRVKTNEGYTARDLLEALREQVLLEDETGRPAAACVAAAKLSRLLQDAGDQIADTRRQAVGPWIAGRLKACAIAPAASPPD
jgi:serine/threonine protein kinase